MQNRPAKSKTTCFAVESMLQRLLVSKLLVNKFGLNQLIAGRVDLRLNYRSRGLSSENMASNGPCSADEKFNLITRNLQVRALGNGAKHTVDFLRDLSVSVV